MISRYTRPEMGRIFSDENRYAVWLAVELAHLETLEEHGIAPTGTVAAVRAKARIRPERVDELEATLQHDVIAFLTSISEELGSEKQWLHYGMTSSDLVDTAQALLLLQAADRIAPAWDRVGEILEELATRHRTVPMVGRTHGVHAEPITFGFKVLGWYAEASRDCGRLRRARNEIAYGKLSGAVGTAAHLAPAIEAGVMHRLGLQPEPAATQVVPRDRHASFLQTLALVATSMERWAGEIRHLQKTEVRELEEPFGKGQKGSSAMPHKRNPVVCERIAGLARVLRANAAASLENVALWHERDISHSSAERVILADACIALDYMIERMTFVLSGLVVRPEAMLRNLESTGGLIYSQRVLLALTEAWRDREKAYRFVQTHAMDVWERGGSLRDRLLGDPEVTAILDKDRIDSLFFPDAFTHNLDEVFARTLAVPWGDA